MLMKLVILDEKVKGHGIEDVLSSAGFSEISPVGKVRVFRKGDASREIRLLPGMGHSVDADVIDAFLVHTSDIHPAAAWNDVRDAVKTGLFVLYSGGGENAPELIAKGLRTEWGAEIRAFSARSLVHRLKEALEANNTDAFLRPSVMTIALDLLNALWCVGLLWEKTGTKPSCLHENMTLWDYVVEGRSIRERWDKVNDLRSKPIDPWDGGLMTAGVICQHLIPAESYDLFHAELGKVRESLMSWVVANMAST